MPRDTGAENPADALEALQVDLVTSRINQLGLVVAG